MSPEEIQGRILYRDAMMLVINKPAGIAVHEAHPNARHRGHHMEQYFPHLMFGLPQPPMLAHRLDKDTSGCLVLGRHRKALDDLSKLFRESKMEKVYWALVQGGPAEDRGRIDMPLGKMDRSKGWWMKPDPEGLPAQTEWFVMGRAAGVTWIELKPETGQIGRAHV